MDINKLIAKSMVAAAQSADYKIFPKSAVTIGYELQHFISVSAGGWVTLADGDGLTGFSDLAKLLIQHKIDDPTGHFRIIAIVEVKS